MADDNQKSDNNYIVIAGRRRWFDRMRPAKPTLMEPRQEGQRPKAGDPIQ